ncbi:ATP-binding cassette domain-containing protein, partial [Kitasatospora sp. NPDC036755]|uniref:ATP-binding cassette domain-containing protein n=1 Tax=Kitasatospora sp. NPDC036755 TaxID=3154600 RepID=UPI0033D61FCF
GRPRGLRHAGVLLDAGDAHGGRTGRAQLLALARANAIPAARVEEVLAEVGLGEAAGRRIRGYSLGMRQRLGIAGALLGDPPVLLFDEPLNGLDPEGVLWVRGLFRRLAREGRTVFVSSHMMAEMEHTADHLVVVGRGRLLADESLAEFSARAGRARQDGPGGRTGGAGRAGVTVRAAEPDRLAAVLTAAGATVRPGPDGALAVSGMDATRIGELALEQRLLLHALTTRGASLEEAFMDLTADSVEYPAGEPR